ncbi:MAG: hypothetical protein ACOX6I_10570 [Syntrophomonadaceae bacterium]|jgi:hypothetical protein
MLKRLKLVSLWLIVFTFLSWFQVAAAADVEWELTWKDNNHIYEQVTCKKEVPKLLTDWQYTRSGNTTVLERELKDWAAYEQLTDRIPLEVNTKDYLLVKAITFTAAPSKAGDQTLYYLAAHANGTDLKITVPGLIRGSTADQVKGFTALWQLNNIEELNSSAPVLKVIAFNGLILGMVLAVLGLVVIMLLLWRKVKKTYKLIEEVYSIEDLPEPDQEKE